MANRTVSLSDDLYKYLLENSLREPSDLRGLREETERLPNCGMQTSPEQAQFFQLLLRLMGARNVVEVGIFTGYCTLAMALVLPKDGRIIACDNNSEYTDIAMKHWQRAGVAQRIVLKLSPALKTLDDLLAEGRGGTFDFAYIDADKREYAEYFERCLKLIRSGGLIAIDNVLWSGAVIDPNDTDADTVAIKMLNSSLVSDNRVILSMLPLGDGLTLALKK